MLMSLISLSDDEIEAVTAAVSEWCKAPTIATLTVLMTVEQSPSPWTSPNPSYPRTPSSVS